METEEKNLTLLDACFLRDVYVPYEPAELNGLFEMISRRATNLLFEVFEDVVHITRTHSFVKCMRRVKGALVLCDLLSGERKERVMRRYKISEDAMLRCEKAARSIQAITTAQGRYYIRLWNFRFLPEELRRARHLKVQRDGKHWVVKDKEEKSVVVGDGLKCTCNYWCRHILAVQRHLKDWGVLEAERILIECSKMNIANRPFIQALEIMWIRGY